MSRREHHERKEFYKKLAFYLILLSVIAWFMITFGLKAIINTSLMLTGGTASDETEESTENFYGVMRIDTIPTATNSADFAVTGLASNFNNVEFFINGTSVKEIDLDNSETFDETIGELEPGENEVYAEAVTEDNKQKKQSQKYTVIYKNEKPKIEVTEPQDNAEVRTQELYVVGTTDKENTVKINDYPVVVDTQGGFRSLLRLKEGENKIDIMVEDDAGNTETKTITVRYIPD